MASAYTAEHHKALDMMIDDLLIKHGLNETLYYSELLSICAPTTDHPGYKMDQDFEFGEAERQALIMSMRQSKANREDVLREFDKAVEAIASGKPVTVITETDSARALLDGLGFQRL